MSQVWTRLNSRPEARHGTTCLKKGSLVLIKDTTKNKANWKVGRIIDWIVGKDGVTRRYKILTGSGYVIERPQQLVCDLEIGGVGNDSSPSGGNAEPNGNVQQPWPVVRVRREARCTAVDRLVGIMANENEEDWNTSAEHRMTVRQYRNYFMHLKRISYHFVSQLFFLIRGYNEQWNR